MHLQGGIVSILEIFPPPCFSRKSQEISFTLRFRVRTDFGSIVHHVLNYFFRSPLTCSRIDRTHQASWYVEDMMYYTTKFHFHANQIVNQICQKETQKKQEQKQDMKCIKQDGISI